MIATVVWENRKTGEKSETKFECVDLDHARKIAKKIRSRGTKILSVVVAASVDLQKND